MIATFWYLIARTTRNRTVSMLMRLKQPRYAIGFVIVVVYFGALLWNSLSNATGPRSARLDLLHDDVTRLFAPAALAAILLTNWIGGTALSALTFSAAEVAMLFPAPVQRRALILYKLARAQMPILFNVVLVAVLWGGGATVVPLWLSAIGLYTMFATMHLHRLGVALVRVSSIEHGKAAIKRNWPSQVIGLVVLFAIVMVVMDASRGTDAGAAATGTFVTRLTAALSVPWVQVVLTPFALITGPAFATSPSAWGVALVGAVGMLALHLIWVLRSQVAFEEAAAEQSAKFSAMVESFRKRGITAQQGPVKVGRLSIPLAPLGPPAMAIVWKNTLNFMRTFNPTQMGLVIAAPAVVGGVFSMNGGDPFVAIASISGLMALMLLIAGGMTARNDLRADLLNLSMLKTMPLRGREVVLAEVSSSALPLALMQCLLLWMGLAALQASKNPMPAGAATSLALTLPIGLAGLNLLASTIQNGIAVLFPAWVKLGAEGGPGGFEVIGQAMLAMLAMFVGFVVLMIAPTLATFIVVAYIKPPPEVAIAAGVIVGAIAVAAESYGVMALLGRTLEKTEPSSVTAA